MASLFFINTLYTAAPKVAHNIACMFLKSATPDFLRLLAENNNREWFDANRTLYDAARKDFEGFIEALRVAMIPLVPEAEAQTAKDTLFRIFRDVRFSADKTPYKKSFSAYFSRGGRKWDGAGYYIHLQPGQSFLAAGIWMPEPPLLKKIRQEIDYGFAEWQPLVESKPFVRTFGKIEGEALTKVPKGYEPDNPAGDYLKHKSFIFSAKLPDELFTKKDAIPKIVALFTKLEPVVEFLNRAKEE
jgi:uncharacterized protein (TIGR02453 family)